MEKKQGIPLKVRCGASNLTFHINVIDDKRHTDRVMFCGGGKGGSCLRCLVDTICRLSSKVLDLGGSYGDLSEIMIGHHCEGRWDIGEEKHHSCVDGIGKKFKILEETHEHKLCPSATQVGAGETDKKGEGSLIQKD